MENMGVDSLKIIDFKYDFDSQSCTFVTDWFQRMIVWQLRLSLQCYLNVTFAQNRVAIRLVTHHIEA